MLFKFCKLTRRHRQDDDNDDQMASDNVNNNNNDKKTFVGRISRSLSAIRRRRSKSTPGNSNNNVDNNNNNNNNNNDNIINKDSDHHHYEYLEQDDNLSLCSSIELVRQLHGRQSRASSGAALLGQLNLLPPSDIANNADLAALAALHSRLPSHHHHQHPLYNHQLDSNNQQSTSAKQDFEPPTMYDANDDDDVQVADAPAPLDVEEDQPAPVADAPPVLASLTNLDNNNNFDDDDETTEHEERAIAERRANYVRRNIGTLQRTGANMGLKTGNKQEAEWMFKLYDLPGSDSDNNKQADLKHVAKSIRKTLVSSLTPLLVSTTSALRQIATSHTHHQTADAMADGVRQQQTSSAAGTNSTSTAPTVHLHIRMTPELTTSSTSPECQRSDSASPSQSNGDAVCVVRVSASISSEQPNQQQPPASMPVPAVDASNNNNHNNKHKSLAYVDDIMLRSMPAQLFDNRALMKNDRRHRRQNDQHNNRLIDSGVQTVDALSSQPLVASIYASNYVSDEADMIDKDVSPVFFQQQILMRNERRLQQQQQRRQQGDVRRAKVVTLGQQQFYQQQFNNFQQFDDLYSNTSVLGTFEERQTSIAKCLDWMAKIDEDEDFVVPSSSPPPARRPHKHLSAKHSKQPAVDSPQIAVGAGESLAPCPCNRHVHEHHHIHHHKHFVARV